MNIEGLAFLAQVVINAHSTLVPYSLNVPHLTVIACDVVVNSLGFVNLSNERGLLKLPRLLLSYNNFSRGQMLFQKGREKAL